MRRFGRSLVVASAVLAPLACNPTENLPPPLGNCTPTGDASCQAPAAGVSGGGGPSGGAAGGEAGADGATGGGPFSDAAAGVCGQADGLVTASNVDCSPCVTNNCCMADQACSASADCMALLQCIVHVCASGNPTCIGSCENAHPAGVTAYQDFASCLQMQCSPQCPTLPTQTSGDF